MNDRDNYDGIGAPLDLGKALPDPSDEELDALLLGRLDPRDLSQLARVSERIERQLLQETKERKEADEQNRRKSRKWNIITLIVSVFGASVGSLLLQWLKDVWCSVCDWFTKLP